jgi:hypothetical protein
MGEFVGVLPLMDYEGEFLEPLPSLKREALLFDRLALPGLSTLLSRKGLDEAVAADLQWLINKEIVWEPNVDYSGLGRAPIVRLYAPRMMPAIDVDANTCLWLAQHGYEPVMIVASHSDLAARFYVDDLDPNHRTMLQMMERAVTMMNAGQGQGSFVIDGRVLPIEAAQQVQPPPDPLPGVEFVIKEFPEPDEMTAWEEIADFRADPAARDHLWGFRRWLQKVSKDGLTGRDAVEELRDLLAVYNQHLSVHKMKTNLGLLESLVVGGAALVENLAKFKLTELAKLPFVAKHRRIELLEAELKAPGREVAYIAKARTRFGQQ